MIKISTLVSLVGLIALFGSPALGQESYGKVGSWEITAESDQTCQALIYYQDDEEGMSLRFNAETNNVIIQISNRDTSSLVTGHEYELDIVFGTNDRRENSGNDWTGIIFFGYRGTGLLGSRMLFSQHLSSDFLEDFARYDRVGFFYEGAIVQLYDLARTSQVVTMLRECGNHVIGRNANDPFAE